MTNLPTRQLFHIKKLFVSSLFLFLTACASFSEQSPNNDENSRDNEFLNDGYSLLYQAVSGLRFSDDLLLVKSESDTVKNVEENIADTASTMRGELEQLAEDYPAIDIERSPLPEIEVKKRSAVSKDRLLSFAPLVGRSGPAFERTLLLSNSGALNQTSFLCKVMAEKEPDEQLRKYLEQCEQRFSDLYDEVVVLLNKEYFIDDTYRPES